MRIYFPKLVAISLFALTNQSAYAQRMCALGETEANATLTPEVPLNCRPFIYDPPMDYPVITAPQLRYDPPQLLTPDTNASELVLLPNHRTDNPDDNLNRDQLTADISLSPIEDR